MAFQIDTPPGITDIPDSLLAEGAIASGFVFSALKDNASFGSVAPEVFFGTYANGQTVQPPISTVDGYQYEQSELLYCWEVYNTLPNGSASPSTSGALRACEWFVDQLTGTVHTVEYYAVGNLKQGGGPTTDGVLGVWTIGIRGRGLRTLSQRYSNPSPLVASYGSIPATASSVSYNTSQYEVNGPQLRTKGGVSPGIVTDYVVPMGFGLVVPLGVTIRGVAVSTNWLGQYSGTGLLSSVALYYRGSIIGANKTPDINNTPSPSTTLMGSNSDDWGASLTPAIVNDPSFGVGFQVTTQESGGSDRSFFNNFTVTVYYSVSAPPPPNPPRGYTDLPNSTFAEDNAARPTPLQELSYNGKLGSVQCEVFAVNPSNASAWLPNVIYAAGDLVQPTQAKCNGFWFIAANNGESGAQEPNWPSLFRNAAPIPDGGVLWNSAGCGFLNGQAIPYPISEIDGYEYSSADSIIPHASFISTESMPIQFHSGVIDSSAPYPASSFMKSIVFTQPDLPTATTNRNFAPLIAVLSGSSDQFTIFPANLRLGTGTFVAPPAMALASPLLTPGTTAESAGVVGIVNCSVHYTSGVYTDGTVMVTLFCFRSIATMDPNPDSSPAGGNFTDFSTIAMSTGNPLPGLTSPAASGNYMADINENAKFSILRPEVFFCSYVAPPAGTTQVGYFITSPDIIPGGQVPVPTSPTDGYIYSRAELTYLWWFTASGGYAPPGSQMVFGMYVDPQSGVINSTDQTISPGATTAGTNDSSVVTVIFGPGGLLENNNNPGVAVPPYYQPTLNVIIFAQRNHETELQAQVIYSTTPSAAQPSSNNLIPNGGFEVWSTPNPNYADITGTADDWFVNWEEGGTSTTDMGVITALFQFPGENAQSGAGPDAPYGALLGQFAQSLAVIPSAANNNGAGDTGSRKYIPLPNGSATLSAVSEIIPVWPGGEYALGFLAASYATTDFAAGGGTGSPIAGVSPDWIGAGFYARVHLLGQQTDGSGQPDMGTDTVFELIGDQANGGALGLPAGLAVGTNNGYGIGVPGTLVSPPMCEQFNFTFTVPATAGVSSLPLTGTLAPGNSLTPAANVPTASFNFSTDSAFFSTGLPATGPETIDFVPYFLYVEILLWDISGSGYNHLRVAVIDNVNLQDLTTGSSALLQVSNLGTASPATSANLASAIGTTPIAHATVADVVPASGVTGATLAAGVTSSSLTEVGTLTAGTVPTALIAGGGLPVYANNAAAIAGGLVAGNLYQNGADPSLICVVT